MTVSSETLYKHLEQISANSRDVGRVKGNSQSLPEVQANATMMQANATMVQKPGGDNKKQSSAKKGMCFDFVKTGVCTRTGCKFSHETQKPSSAAYVSPRVADKIFPLNRSVYVTVVMYLFSQHITDIREESTSKSNVVFVNEGGGSMSLVALTSRASDGTMVENFSLILGPTGLFTQMVVQLQVSTALK